ncbi:MAG: type III effector protein [Prevotella sp.]|nr:type III effector protein [Prevotella sp.]
MNNVVVIVIGVVLVLALVYLNYRHNHRFSFDESRLRATVDRIFRETGASMLSKKDFIYKLKQILNCTQKEALYLYGLARGKGMIVDDNKEVRLAA